MSDEIVATTRLDQEIMPTDDRGLRVRFFGAFSVSRDGVPLAGTYWGRTGTQTLLKWFLLHPGERFSAAQLTALFPPTRRAASGGNRLHVALHALRRTLEPELQRRRASSFVHVDGAGRYWFEADGRWQCDIEVVESLWSRLRCVTGSRHEAQIRLYERLLGFLRQGFLPEDIYDDSFASLRERYTHLHVESLSAILDLYVDNGLAYETLACGLELLGLDPYSERALSAVVDVHLRQGNVTAAWTHLTGFVDVLERDLGLAPDLPLRQLTRRVTAARGRTTTPSLPRSMSTSGNGPSRAGVHITAGSARKAR
ncbi:MAG: AfsR/SARP family transcriptional regulator [Pseudonocardia sp.]